MSSFDRDVASWQRSQQRKRTRRDRTFDSIFNMSGGALIIGGLIACLIVGALCVSSYSHISKVNNVTITGKESVNTSSGHEYRIYTDQGTFVAKDSIVHPRFNTADFYGSLKVNTKYNCEAFGWRIPFFSSFRNLQKCKVAS